MYEMIYLIISLEAGHSTALLLLDLSAAFDTNHTIVHNSLIYR